MEHIPCKIYFGFQNTKSKYVYSIGQLHSLFTWNRIPKQNPYNFCTSSRISHMPWELLCTLSLWWQSTLEYRNIKSALLKRSNLVFSPQQQPALCALETIFMCDIPLLFIIHSGSDKEKPEWQKNLLHHVYFTIIFCKWNHKCVILYI